MRNPYKPGAGRRPPVLAGRSALIDAVSEEMARVEDDATGDQPYIIWGLRGMGKTALLKEFVDSARKRGWVTIFLEAASGESLAARISQAAAVELRRLRGLHQALPDAFRHALGVFRSFQMRFDPSGALAVGIEVEPTRGFADSGNFAADLRDLLAALGEAAREAGSATLVGIDELQEANRDDLAALNRALHAIGQEVDPVPLVFIGTGLPSLPAVLAEATSYAERMYRYFSIGPLSDQEARQALEEPAALEGVAWSQEALEAAASAASGYPYFVQQFGRSIWDQRLREAEVTLDDCTTGIELARDEINRGLYRSRWERAVNGERDFMRAMAQDDGPSSLSDLVTRLGKREQKELSVVRSRLIQSGQVYVPGRGKLAFAVPGMGDYIRQMET